MAAPARRTTQALARLVATRAPASAPAAAPAARRYASTESASSSSSSASSSSSSSSSGYSSRAPIPQLPPVAPLPSRLKPASPSYYTGRPLYIDTILQLDSLYLSVRRTLTLAHVLPNNSGPPPAPKTGRRNLWLSRDKLATVVGTQLKASQYRQIVTRLALLARFRHLVAEHLAPAADDRHKRDVAAKFVETLARYMNEAAKEELESTGEKAFKNGKGVIDQHGRAYARGRRKESSARVWLVPASSSSAPASTPANIGGQVLVNNTPLPDFFTRNTDRETVTWPFKLTGTLGGYNVFAIVRGGGTSGQAAAIAHGISNALVTLVGQDIHDEKTRLDVKAVARRVLAKDGVLKRDPRVVERKKTGLAKARKAYTWVKR
ncbi:uncharacterized protein PFL1_02987 [Pseudozyma flocculosa PF-1]|uniref:Related to MRPS9 - mitochondrial ribosomal protein, small subunit n=2 Tax=Pseudozyma flocculosa TaxID=84751 RepID=A0A5C3F0D5_9BASI|nr:uncharacterized protein PFL1_02987 [Pseudozyma flocculosa PF-1]EPQ29232.1 hypothetical protein PFL1_02987 [Pseudozyma flocculosa PF-1]SPO37732.1 related to MRPS9 - mitochondrial ribosomal protein, small subunit [Pseudozyma flocculosa]